MLVVPEQSPPHFGLSSFGSWGLGVISVSFHKEVRLLTGTVLCLRPAGQGRLRQHKHRTTESDSFWEDAGHADVATGRAILVCVPEVSKALALFLFIDKVIGQH